MMSVMAWKVTCWASSAAWRLSCSMVWIAASRWAWVGRIALGRGGDDAHAQRLGQQELVAGPGAALFSHPAGMDRAHHRQPKLGLVVVDGVPAGDHPAGLGHLFRRAAQDLADGRGGSLGGKAAMLRARSTCPPMAYTSLMALAAATAP